MYVATEQATVEAVSYPARMGGYERVSYRDMADDLIAYMTEVCSEKHRRAFHQARQSQDGTVVRHSSELALRSRQLTDHCDDDVEADLDLHHEIRCICLHSAFDNPGMLHALSRDRFFRE